MKYYMAPMEGITTYIFRNAYAHHFGRIEQYYTPFLSPHKDKTLNQKELRDILPEHNSGICVIPQILTNSAQDFLKTVKEIEAIGYQEVNLNLGCPSATVTAKGKGAGFLADTDRLEAFLTEIFEHCPLRISIKTRIGMNEPQEWEELMRIYQQYPIQELLIHPRVRQDFYKNEPNWEVFDKALRESRIPVCYNGDIFQKKDYEKLCAAFPKLEAVMLGRGLIANPNLAGELQGEKELDKETLRAFHDEIYAEYKGVQSGERNVLFRMKELWFYMIKIFENPEKYAKKIRKAQRCADYEAAVSSLFREQQLKAESDREMHW